MWKDMSKPKPLTVTLVGAGLRGMIYSGYALQRPEEMQIVAVADPDEVRRGRCQAKFGIADEQCFASWDELFAGPRQSDAVFICTRTGTTMSRP